MELIIKKIGIFFCLVFFAVSCSSGNLSPANNIKPAYDYSHKLQVGKEILFVEVVSDSKKMQDGLSNRESLAENNGMLFDFGKEKTAPTFWMKDMKFDLDLIWIADKKIIGITPNVHAPIGNWKLEIGNFPLYSPPAPITQVLEVNSGWSNKHEIKTGDDVSLVNYSN
ncbi:MAG: DUF192 domain-containing protein [Candidatus Doudnabacteria bacterium]|nr:DUF192 domain-containing protein [Candidatus Doudnabacteria bacterium]